MSDIKAATVSCGSERNEKVIKNTSEMGTVKIENSAADAENRDEGILSGAEKRTQAAGWVTSILTLHQSKETRNNLTLNSLRKGNSDKAEDNVGECGVTSSGIKRNRWRKNPRQEELSERRTRRSLRHAREEDLAGLEVQFRDASDGLETEDETAARKKTKQREKSSQPRGRKPQAVKKSAGRRGRKARMATCTVDMGTEVWEQWRRIGAEQGLHTDADIAAMLVRHYQAMDKLCFICQSPLQLLCPSCPLPQPFTVSTPTVSCPPPSSPKAATKLSPSPSPEPVVKEEDTEEVEVKSLPLKTEEPVKLKSRRTRKRTQGQQSHVCSDCGATFVRAAALKVHMRKHTGEKPFSCSECSRSFSTSGQLVNHGRKHTGERPYVCNVCSATFPIASSLKQHSRIHTGDRPYACLICQQRFCYRGDLTAHVRKHTGDRPYLCSDCGKSFAMSSHLSKHKRIHSGYRPFECNICHKTFPFLNRLTLHMRTHTGEKPFLCADCGSSFIRASTLTIHRRIHHTFEKPCICPYCNHAFADSANLSKHKKYKHGAQKTAARQPPAATSVTELQEKPSFSEANVTQMNVEGTVVSGSVGECSEKVCSEVSTLQTSGCVRETEGLTVGEDDASDLGQLKPVGPPWKVFPFPL